MNVASISQIFPIIQDLKENQLFQVEYHVQNLIDKLQVESTDIDTLITETNDFFDSLKNSWSTLLTKVKSNDPIESYQTVQSKTTIGKVITFMFQDEISNIQLPSYLIEEYPDSLFYKYYKDPECYDSEGYIYVDHPSSLLPELVSYMKSKSLDLDRIPEEDRYLLYEQFVFYNIPVPVQLLPYNFSVISEKLWNLDYIHVIVNNIPYTIYKSLLEAREIKNSVFQQRESTLFSLDIHTKSFVCTEDVQFFNYLYQYICNGVFLLPEASENQYDIIKSIISESSIFNIHIDEKLFIRYAPLDSEDRYKDSKLLDKKSRKVLTEWCGVEKQWRVLFRASEHQFSAKDFHYICDNQGETIVVVKARDYTTNVLFGGYSFVSWTSESMEFVSSQESIDQYYYDPFAFIFSIENPYHLPPHQFPIQNSQHAIRCVPNAGPIFGENDIFISNNCNMNDQSFIGCDGTHSYKNNSNKKMAIFTKTGPISQMNNFFVTDYEVFVRA